MMTETLTNLHVTNSTFTSQYTRPPYYTNYTSNATRKSETAASLVRNERALTVSYNNAHQRPDFKRTASFITGQKLRESKWFDLDELRIFCAVVESGFVVEQKVNGQDQSNYGVAVWAQNFEKSKNPEHLTIYMMHIDNGKYRVLACRLEEFWPKGTKVRINNQSDKTQTPLPEDQIRNQIYAAQHMRRKWHNTEHFAFFCRYGPVETIKFRKITDQLRSTTGMFFLKLRRLTAK